MHRFRIALHTYPLSSLELFSFYLLSFPFFPSALTIVPHVSPFFTTLRAYTYISCTTSAHPHTVHIPAYILCTFVFPSFYFSIAL
jgi:hypothetical protein